MSTKEASYMWYPLEDGTVIIDEWCTCGHKKSEHGNTIVVGHGACNFKRCKCHKFTWREHVVIPNPELKHG